MEFLTGPGGEYEGKTEGARGRRVTLVVDICQEDRVLLKLLLIERIVPVLCLDSREEEELRRARRSSERSGEVEKSQLPHLH